MKLDIQLLDQISFKNNCKTPLKCERQAGHYFKYNYNVNIIFFEFMKLLLEKAAKFKM